MTPSTLEPSANALVWWGIAFDSEVDFAGHPRLRSDVFPRFRIRRALMPADLPKNQLGQWPEIDPILQIFEATGGGLLYRFVDQADFWFNPSAPEIVVDSKPELAADQLSQRLIGQAIPMAMAELGRLVLHGSAVSMAGGTIGFLAASGVGKSTLLASLATAGHTPFADDCLVLEPSGGRFVASPGPRVIRLCEDSAELAAKSLANNTWPATGEKVEIRPAEWSSSDRPTPIRKFYVLEPSTDGPTIRTEKLSPPAAHIEIERHAMGFRRRGRAASAVEFDQVIALLQQTPVYRLVYPRRFDRLQDVVAFLSIEMERS